MRFPITLVAGALTLAACGGASHERSDADRVRDTLGAFGEASAKVHTTAANQAASDDTVALVKEGGDWKIGALSGG